MAKKLSELFGQEVQLAPDCVGEAVEQLVNALAPGEALLLENLRFHPEEEANDERLLAALARLADVYINDAFGTAHRAHASTAGMVRYVHGARRRLPDAKGMRVSRQGPARSATARRSPSSAAPRSPTRSRWSIT